MRGSTESRITAEPKGVPDMGAQHSDTLRMREVPEKSLSYTAAEDPRALQTIRLSSVAMLHPGAKAADSIRSNGEFAPVVSTYLYVWMDVWMYGSNTCVCMYIHIAS